MITSIPIVMNIRRTIPQTTLWLYKISEIYPNLPKFAQIWALSSRIQKRAPKKLDSSSKITLEYVEIMCPVKSSNKSFSHPRLYYYSVLKSTENKNRDEKLWYV